MIYVQRNPAPPDFYRLEWRTRYLRTMRQWLQQPPAQRGAPPPIELQGDKVRQLLPLINAQFAHKCAFCETRLDGQQEMLMYFRPQGNVQPPSDEHHYYWLALDWSNLYLSCRECFLLRGSEFPVANQRVTADLAHLERENAYPYFIEEKPLLVDPCLEVPVEYLQFNDEGEILPRKGGRGRYTIHLFELNREPLVRARKQEAQHLKATWLAARKQMIERSGHIDTGLAALVTRLTAACEPTSQFAGMKAYLLLDWLISETRIALDSADIFRAALEQEPWQRLYRTAMTTLKLEKPRPTLDQPERDDPDQTTPIPQAGVTYIYIQGDMYQIGTITHSTVAIGRNASSRDHTVP